MQRYRCGSDLSLFVEQYGGKCDLVRNEGGEEECWMSSRQRVLYIDLLLPC